MTNQHSERDETLHWARQVIANNPPSAFVNSWSEVRLAREFVSLFEQFQALEREADNLTERLEKRIDEDSVYRVYDEQVEENQRLKEQLQVAQRTEAALRTEYHGLEEQVQSLEREAEIQNDEAERLHEQLEARQRVIDRFLEWDALTVLPDPLPAPFADLHYFLGEFCRVESTEHAVRYGRSNPASSPKEGA